MEQEELSAIVGHIEAQEWSLLGGAAARFLNYAREELKAQRDLDIRVLRAALALLQSGVRAVEGRPKAGGKTSRVAPRRKSAADLLNEI